MRVPSPAPSPAPSLAPSPAPSLAPSPAPRNTKEKLRIRVRIQKWMRSQSYNCYYAHMLAIPKGIRGAGLGARLGAGLGARRGGGLVPDTRHPSSRARCNSRTSCRSASAVFSGTGQICATGVEFMRLASSMNPCGVGCRPSMSCQAVRIK